MLRDSQNKTSEIIQQQMQPVATILQQASAGQGRLLGSLGTEVLDLTCHPLPKATPKHRQFT